MLFFENMGFVITTAGLVCSQNDGGILEARWGVSLCQMTSWDVERQRHKMSRSHGGKRSDFGFLGYPIAINCRCITTFRWNICFFKDDNLVLRWVPSPRGNAQQYSCQSNILLPSTGLSRELNTSVSNESRAPYFNDWDIIKA
jgi:hypothetical protein